MIREALDTEPEYILGTAVKIGETVYRGNAHQEIREKNNFKGGEEGFWTSKRDFVDRAVAFVIAADNGQLMPNSASDREKILYSGNFWSPEVVAERRRLFPNE